MTNKQPLTVSPITEENWHNENVRTEGLLLRDYFAAKALQGWLASYPEASSHPVVAGNENKVAKEAYQMADAMINARG
ncbi:hypothetical protein [Yersinia pseudotuberculosis]|uniref:hypothetical protein n=1 Tax=Yersinia pseudotuberculosis TaxID=633 RepID=UPI00061CCE09|nr:hypothetical protein [Yersinia pseudotuberculosis]CNJ09923.1 Uncharacterised protein [Yersinia pseudotuberculosis]VEE71636.1 Uncharacterised protein [Yersinia pseudotuberculosis]